MTFIGLTIDYSLASSGRLMSLAVRIPDTQGRLAAILGLVAEHSMNVRYAELCRGELHVPVGMTEIILQMGPRNAAYQDELTKHFGRQRVAVRRLGAGGGWVGGKRPGWDVRSSRSTADVPAFTPVR